MEFNFRESFYYAKNATSDQLARRALVYNAYIPLVYADGRPSVGHDIILTIIGSIFGPLISLNDTKKEQLHDYLESIERGINTPWYTLTLQWFHDKVKTQENANYFTEMINILHSKSDEVYSFLCENSNIPVNKLVPTNMVDVFDGNMHIYYTNDMYDSNKSNFNKKSTRNSNNRFQSNLYFEEDPENPFGVYKPWK